MDIKDLRPKVFAADPHSKDCRKTVGFPIFARYLLKTCRQQTGESLEDYFQKLKSLSMDCNFAAVSAIQHKEEAVKDAFISGLALPDIRQRILKNPQLDLQATLAMAQSLDAVRNNSLQIRQCYPKFIRISYYNKIYKR